MANDSWLSAYYVSKFINTSRNSGNLPIPLAVGSSIMIRQLALDRAFRRDVLRERRRALRAAREGGAWQAWMLSNRVAGESCANSVLDFGEDEWFTDEDDDEEEVEEEVTTAIDSAVLRESRLRVMKQLPKCFDQEMAERYKTMKQLRNDEMSEPKTMSEWNTLRKRLISAKIREIEDNKISISDSVYTIVKKIGDGGFSSIYHVYDKNRKSYAVKIVNLLKSDGYTDKDLMNEINLLTSLQESPNVITVHAWEHRQTDQVDLLYMVMEHGDADLGLILKEHRSNENLSINKIRYFWEEILKCVEAVHDKNIIHLDLKPDNFLMSNGVLKVIDFGLAHSMPGSFQYSPPENFRFMYDDGTFAKDPNDFDYESDDEDDEEREKHIELRSSADIWSCGIILFMMVHNGMQPYSNIGGGKTSKIFALKSWREVDLPAVKFPENIVSGLNQTLKSTLRKDPKERADVKELQSLSFLKGPYLEKF